MNQTNFIFTPENVSKYWNLLNYSNNPNDKKQANDFIIAFKKNCSQCLEISIELFKSNSLDDKIISSLLLYQYIKDNPKLLLENEQRFTQLKEYLLNTILIPYATSNDTESNDQQNITKTKEALIIERTCFSMSIIVLVGSCSFWPNAISEMINFGKLTLKHTYLITIIFANCNNELSELFLSNNHEFIIKSKFIEQKEEFKNIINTIFINTDKINKKLYNKTVDLAINLTNFEVNILEIPKMIQVVLSDINLSNIDSLTKLFTESIKYSKCKKPEDNNDLDISEYDTKITKEELESFNYIIDIIISYLQNNGNNLNEDIAFGLGQILSSFTENFVYMIFKKDSMSQKIFNLFFYFICHKMRKISQLFFETISVIRNFIKENYKFSNYSSDEKIQFMNFLLKILFNITNNCIYKKILKKQDILLAEEYITIQNNNSNNNIINGSNKEIEEDVIDDINEITIEDYRTAAEEVYINVFAIFAENYDKSGVNYFFTEITKDIIPLLSKNINEINEQNLLSIEVVIYIIKIISNIFEELDIDKTPLNQFVLIMIKSQVISNNFILVNFLLLLDEASGSLNFTDTFFSDLILFLLNHLSMKMNSDFNSNQMNKLISLILNHICDECGNLFVPEVWDKIYQVYVYYYDKFNFESLFNITESLCSLLTFEENENQNIPNNIPSKDEIINYFIKIIELSIIRIIKIGEIIENKNKEINGNKEKEEKVKFEIIKNFGVITSILKHSSFIEDKIIINKIFDYFYKKIYRQLNIIISEYNKESEIMNSFMTTFTKCSSLLNTESLNSIYQNFNELMINSFLINNDNYQCINVLKNIYNLKLQNIKDKTSSNKEYVDIYNNFIKLTRQISSAIITSNNDKLELMQCLSSFFFNIFPQLKEINKDDYVIITDTIILFNEGIKIICENRLINNILYAYITFIESPNYELINQKYIDIIRSVFFSFEHFNSNVLKAFCIFCKTCLTINKRDFIIILKEVLNTSDFKCLNEDNKIFFVKYIEHFSNKVENLKKIFESLLQIIKNNKIDSVDDELEKFKKELTYDIQAKNQNN